MSRDHDDEGKPPVAGAVPAEVEMWGAAAQRRWFLKFRDQLPRALPVAVWDRHYFNSEQHRGLCCESCGEDEQHGNFDYDSGLCCCRAGWRSRVQAALDATGLTDV